MSVLEHHWGSKFPTGINKPLHSSRGVGSHFLVHVHINILSTVVIKPNLFLLASSMWCTNAPNNGNIIEIFNDNNVTFSQLLIYFSLLIKGVSPALSTLLCCLLRLTEFFIFFFLCSLRWRPETGAECCWVLLSVARCVGSRDQVQHSSNTLMDIGTPGSQRRRFYPHQLCRGRAERVSVSLWWCTCSGKIVITNCELLFFCYPPTAALQHPTSWFLRSSFAAYH